MFGLTGFRHTDYLPAVALASSSFSLAIVVAAGSFRLPDLLRRLGFVAEWLFDIVHFPWEPLFQFNEEQNEDRPHPGCERELH
jgi:hypothetical protein